MIGALFYLQITTLKNATRARFQRLRNPRYLFAALVGLGYFYFVLFRASGPRASVQPSILPLVQWGELIELVGALVMFGAVALAWILPNSRAALSFTEPEAAFLFPAPVPRRALVNFKLIKSQLNILLSSLVLTLVSNRWEFFGGSAWTRVAGWWLIFSLYNLHMTGASFARERLLTSGLSAVRRRSIVCGVLALLGAITWFWMRRSLPLPVENDLQNIAALLDYVKAVLTSPPLGWVLVPFRWIVRPFLTSTTAGFLSAVWPGMLLLLTHYVWVVRSDVAFEEASVALSEKRAERVAALRAGRWPGTEPKKRRREPFALAPVGMPEPAFLWKALIAAGPLYYPRYSLLGGGVLAAGVVWFGRDPIYRPVIGGIVALCSALSIYGLLFGPVIARRGLVLMLERVDLVKSYPLRGWQVVLGELLCPVTIFCVFEWVVLGLLALAILFLGSGDEVDPGVLFASLAGACLLVVPLAGLLFALNYAGALYFPAWLSSTSQHGVGFEKVGHRLIFFVGYMIVLVVALLPAAGIGAIPFLLLYLYSDWLALAIMLGSVATCAVLAGELAIALWCLGRRFERFDLLAEL